MSAPIKKYSMGKVQGAVWEKEYKGKPSYSMTFQKSYQNKEGKWEQTNFFTMVDIRDLFILIGGILSKQVKEFKNEKPQGNTLPKKDKQEEMNMDTDDFNDSPF